MFYNFETRQVPYGQSFKYAFIVRNTGNILDLSSFKETKYAFSYLAKKYEDSFTTRYGDDLHDPVEYFHHMAQKWMSQFPYGGEDLWEMTERMSDFLAIRTKKDPRMVWRRLLVDLGFDGVKDTQGIIGANEPNQVVMLNPTFVKIKAVINDLNRVPMKGEVL